MDQGVLLKVALSLVGISLFQWGTSYQAHPDAKLLAHLSVIAVAAGSYILGLYQESPFGTSRPPNLKGLWIPAMLAAAAVLTGCASTAGVITPAPATAPAAASSTDAIDALKGHPLLQLAVNDADATLAWVDTEVAAGRLTEPKSTLARACPQAVKFAANDLAQKLDQLKAKLEGLAKGGEAPPGPRLILHLTQLKYGPQLDPQAQLAQLRADVGLRLDALTTGCAHLFPVKQINDLAALAGKAGLLSTVGPLGIFAP